HPGPARECRAGPAQRFVGMPYSHGLEQRAQRAARARLVRVLRPGQGATMDYRIERLNLMLDERNIVRSASCG
ncbi:MAG: I78 family peptidase inhibitor, partial [Sphingomonas bacterium]